MDISKSNYESWFLDYYEGNLSAFQVAELFLFLEENPSLKTEFESFNSVKLTPFENEIFVAKEALKRNVITNDNIDYYLVAEIEKDLNLQEITKLKDFLNRHPELEKDRSLFKKVILNGELEIFPGKKELKKKVLLPFYNQFNFWVVAAAVVLLVLGVLYINRPEDKRQTAESNEGNIGIINNDTVNTRNKINTTEVNAVVHDNKVIPTAPLADQKSTPSTNKNKKQLIRDVPSIKMVVAEKNNNPKKHLPVHSKIYKENDYNLHNNAIDEPLLMANRIEKIVIDYPVTELNIENVTVSHVSSMVRSQKQTLIEKLEALKDVAANKVNTTTGQEIFYNRKELADASAAPIPFKSRMIRLFGWAVNKISGDRIQMKTDFDLEGNLAAYEITAGKLKLEHGF